MAKYNPIAPDIVQRKDNTAVATIPNSGITYESPEAKAERLAQQEMEVAYRKKEGLRSQGIQEENPALKNVNVEFDALMLGKTIANKAIQGTYQAGKGFVQAANAAFKNPVGKAMVGAGFATEGVMDMPHAYSEYAKAKQEGNIGGQWGAAGRMALDATMVLPVLGGVSKFAGEAKAAMFPSEGSKLSKAQNIEYDLQLMKTRAKDAIKGTIDPIRANMNNKLDVWKMKDKELSYIPDYLKEGTVGVEKAYEIKKQENVDLLKDIVRLDYGFDNKKYNLQYKYPDKPAWVKNTQVRHSTVPYDTPIDKQVYGMNAHDTALEPYLGYRLHGDEPIVPRSIYKTYGELVTAVNTGKFKAPAEARLEIAKLIKEQEALYPGTKASGSASLFAEGKVHKFPQDIDLYMEQQGKHKQILLEPHGRHVTNLNAEQLQNQLTAYQNTEEYLARNNAAFMKSMEAKSVVMPELPRMGMDKLEPVKVSMMDAFMSNKKKHLERVDELFTHSNVDELAEIVARKKQIYGKAKLKIPEFDFTDVADNISILDGFKFGGDYDVMVSSPEKMKIYFENQYLNNMLYSRQVRPYDPGSIVGARDYLLSSKGYGGQAYGSGIYYGQGTSNYGQMEGIFHMKSSEIKHPLDILKKKKALHPEIVDTSNFGNRNIFVTQDTKNVDDIAYFVNEGTAQRFNPPGLESVQSKNATVGLPTTVKRTSTFETNVVFPEVRKKFIEKQMGPAYAHHTKVKAAALKKNDRYTNLISNVYFRGMDDERHLRNLNYARDDAFSALKRQQMGMKNRALNTSAVAGLLTPVAGLTGKVMHDVKKQEREFDERDKLRSETKESREMIEKIETLDIELYEKILMKNYINSSSRMPVKDRVAASKLINKYIK